MHTTVGTVKIPWTTVSDIAIQLKRLILCKNANCINTRIHTVRKREINNSVLTTVRNSRFCNVFCKNAKS